MADNLLDKASILLTPTAYNDGRMLSVKPNENLYGSEEVTNGDFATDSDWTKGTGWSISSGTANANSASSSYFYQNINELGVGKTYKVTYTITSYTSGSVVAGIGDLLGNRGVTRNAIGTYTDTITFVNNTANSYFGFFATSSFIGSIDNVSVVEDLSGDFTFSRSSAATRVNAQGLVENVQIISSELVSNGNFSQIGTEEVSNGNFSQEGSELVTNGDFSNGTTDWTPNASATLSIDTGRLKIAISGEASGYAKQDIFTIESGKQYKCTGTVDFGTASQMRFYVSNTGQFFDITQSGNFNFTFTSTGTSTQIRLYTYGDGNYGFWDNISVKEVGQDWILGSGWSIGDGVALNSGGANFSDLTQLNTNITIGKNYKITYTVSDYVSGSFKLIMNSNTTAGLERNADGTYTDYLTSAAPAYSFRTQGSGFIGSISNISVKEVGQDWTFNNADMSIGNNGLEVISQGGNRPQANQNISGLTIGGKYRLSAEAKKGTCNGAVEIEISGIGSTVNTNQNNTTEFKNIFYEFIANSTTHSIQAKIDDGATSVGETAFFKSVSLKEITDDTDLPRINYEGFSYQDSLGSELITNGDFAVDGSWVKGTGWTISDGSANGSSTTTDLYQENVVASGKKYKVTYTISNYVSGSVRVELPNNSHAGTERSANGTYTETILSGGTIVLFDARTSFTGSIDNVSVKEYLGQEVVPDSGCGSWLLEPQSTNLITYSEDFSQSAWTKTAAIVETASITLPDGLSNGYKLFANTTATSHRIEQYPFPTATLGQDYTLSLFVKSAGSNFIQIASSTGLPVKYQNFNISTGVKASGDISGSSITNFGNGWYRISVTETTIGTNARYLIIPILSDVSRNAPFAGNAEEDGVYIYGAQLEQQSYATSYIPTNGATNTRNQDIANNSGNSTLINSTEGVLYCEAATLVDPTSVMIIGLSDGTTANRISITFHSTLNRIQIFAQKNSVQLFNIDNTSVSKTNFNKIAISYSSTSAKFFLNGTLVASATPSDMFVSNTLDRVNFDIGSGSNDFYGKNKALAVYKEALTDANLRSLTYPNPVATTFDLDFDTIAEQFTFTRGSEATFVNAQGLIESTASNDAPRIDYSTGAKAFLLENQSTNIITQSELFSDSSWIKLGAGTGNVAIVTDNYAISPDGTQNASRLQCDLNGGVTSSSNQSLIYDVYSSSGNQTISVYLKSNNEQNQTIYLANTQTSGDTITITSEWQRFEFSHNTSPYVFAVGLRGRSGGAIDDTADILIWGAQAEQQSYATSYIPTSGATATRNQELCNNATPVINSEEGTLYAEISALANDGTYRTISLSNGTLTNRVSVLYSPTSNKVFYYVRNTSGVLLSNNNSVTDIKDTIKIAIKYKSTDFAVWLNGIEVATSTSIGDFSSNNLSKLSFDNAAAPDYFFGNTKGLKYYPKALADVQLQDLTTI